MRTFTCAAIMLVAVAVSAPFARNALAQAGSMGGTVGKQDKGTSGGEEPAAPKSQTRRSAPAPAAAKSSGCGNAVGVYKGFSGITTVIKSGGTATLANGRRERGRAPMVKSLSFGTMGLLITSRRSLADSPR
jgi:hypothetical protein